jgi:hypothetical protein
MSLEDEIAAAISMEIAREIDSEIIADLLKDIGWTSIQFEFKDEDHSNDVNFWLLENCQQQWRRLKRRFLFEDQVDAQQFILRWL